MTSADRVVYRRETVGFIWQQTARNLLPYLSAVENIVLPMTIALIFGLLFFAFGSPRYAGLVSMNVPFALVGGIIFLWLRGIHLSVSAAVGFISLFGVAVMSGVLIVSEINHRRIGIGRWNNFE